MYTTNPCGCIRKIFFTFGSLQDSCLFWAMKSVYIPLTLNIMITTFGSLVFWPNCADVVMNFTPPGFAFIQSWMAGQPKTGAHTHFHFHFVSLPLKTRPWKGCFWWPGWMSFGHRLICNPVFFTRSRVNTTCRYPREMSLDQVTLLLPHHIFKFRNNFNETE